MKKSVENNLGFIDGQNLHLGTTQNNWKVDLYKFRTYLKDKYKTKEVYYFLGYVSEEQQDLYNNLQEAGFIVLFKEHSPNLKAEKKSIPTKTVPPVKTSTFKTFIIGHTIALGSGSS